MTIWSLLWAKVLGYKVIWTVHNVLPHEQRTSNDLYVARLLSRIANRLIIHSKYTIQQMKELGLNTKQTTVIPHGNYINVYADDISVSAAHRKLHVKKNERVILFFGLIRRYKGVEDLIAAFKKADHKNVRLIIAGKCTDASLKQEIIAAQKQYPIDFHDGYVADDQVAAYFKAADVVCLPFKATTTSGSALLALSFGRALIAPRTGALKDVPSTVGYFYDPAKSNDLGQAIQTALIDPGQLERKGNNAHEYALTLDWDKIARKTIKVYEQTSKKVQ